MMMSSVKRLENIK